jgi:hypothetical protein
MEYFLDPLASAPRAVFPDLRSGHPRNFFFECAPASFIQSPRALCKSTSDASLYDHTIALELLDRAIDPHFRASRCVLLQKLRRKPCSKS